MSDLFDDPDAPDNKGANAPEFSVSEISGVVKRMIEGEFSHVRIRGEVGRVSCPRSGHMYLDLKDDRAVLAAVIWKGVVNRLRTRPEEGMEVVATGKLTTFPGQSRYQMVIEDIAPAGVGALMAMLEERRKKLGDEGLFDTARKQPIPYLPDVIGVVTSPSGAVIRDILHRLRDRFPRKVLIWPVAVQGQQSAAEITAAIEGFNKMTPGGAMPRPDLLIVARGGGSIEDLWSFNEENVVRTAAASDIPLISAVGHETDTTLIDHAADVRAPTPTAAAELAVPVRGELLGWLASMEERRVRALGTAILQRRQRLRDLSRALPNPTELVAMQTQRLDILGARLPRALQALTQTRRAQLVQKTAGLRPQLLAQGITNRQAHLTRVAGGFAVAAKTQVARARVKLDGLERLRQTLGYKETLRRGYAVVRDDKGNIVSETAKAKSATALNIEFADGRLNMSSDSTKPKQAKKKSPPEEQGSLF